jgi:hypothetical protein
MAPLDFARDKLTPIGREIAALSSRPRATKKAPHC